MILNRVTKNLDSRPPLPPSQMAELLLRFSRNNLYSEIQIKPLRWHFFKPTAPETFTHWAYGGGGAGFTLWKAPRLLVKFALNHILKVLWFLNVDREAPRHDLKINDESLRNPRWADLISRVSFSIDCVTLGELVNFQSPGFIICKMEENIEPIRGGGCEI